MKYVDIYIMVRYSRCSDEHQKNMYFQYIKHQSEVKLLATLSEMKFLSTLSVMEKLHTLRNHHGLSQSDFARLAKTNLDTIVEIEEGRMSYTLTQENKLRAHFGLCGLPLSDEERAVFKEERYRYRDFIRAGNLTAAREAQKDLENIDNLEPCDPDMVMLSKIFEAQMLMAEDDCKSAEEKLIAVQDHLSNTSKENQYHYNYSMGFLNCKLGDYNSGTMFFEKAYELQDDNANLLPEEDLRLYHNLALCYGYIEKLHKAIFFLNLSLQKQPEDRNANLYLHLGIGLTLSYIKVNHIREAEKIIEKCMIKAKSTKDDTNIGRILFCYGCLYEKREDWDLAIDYLDQALTYHLKGTDNYCAALFHKIQCIIKNRKFADAERELKIAKDIYTKNELWPIYFEAQGYYLTISRRISQNNEVASTYLETVAIPYFRKNHDHIAALEYCKFLSRHYEKSGQSKKALHMKSMVVEIYDWIYCL